MDAEAPPIRALAVGEVPSALGELPGVELERAPDLEAGVERAAEGGLDVVVVPVDPRDPAAAVHAFLDRFAGLGLLAVVPDGSVAVAAMEAGATDHLLPDADAETVDRAIRYATTILRLERELHRRQITDEATGLLNARGFEQLASHHLLLADRSKIPVAIVFVRLQEPGGLEEVPSRIAEAAEVLREAVRDSDVLARVGIDVFAVLLTGDAHGAESLVLSRLVEALAVHDTAGGAPLALRLAVGAAIYDPADPTPLERLMAEAHGRMREPGEPAPTGG